MSNRYVVVPTVTVLAVMKGRLTGAVKGHALLKKKADALTMRFRQILRKIVQTKQDMGKNMRQSAFALTEAKYAAGDFRHTVLDGVETATVKVHAQQDNVAGWSFYLMLMVCIAACALLLEYRTKNSSTLRQRCLSLQCMQPEMRSACDQNNSHADVDMQVSRSPSLNSYTLEGKTTRSA